LKDEVSGSPFVVHVAKLRRAQGTRWHEVRRGSIEDLSCSGSAVADDSEVEADVTLESVAGGISVVGVLSGAWVGECRRCLNPAEGELKVRVLEHFTEEGDGSDTYPLVDDVVDLEPMAHDALLLELPMAPLCGPGCRGLCPTCGVNLNEESCSCGSQAADPRWAALSALSFAPDSDRDSRSDADPGTGPDSDRESRVDASSELGHASSGSRTTATREAEGG